MRLVVPFVVVLLASLVLPAVAGAAASGSSKRHSSGSSSSSRASGLRTHVVKKGDSVPSIARRYGVSADDIRVANGIVDDKLYLGAQLIIDPSAAPDASSAATSTKRSTKATSATSGATPAMQRISSSTKAASYTVQDGDYLDGIARRHRVPLSSLLAANKLTATSLILPGDKLVIPSGSAATAADPSKGGTGSTTTTSIVTSAGPTLRCPVRGATFMNDWGFPRDGGTRFHQGTDMFAPKGTTIVAPSSGTVVFGTDNLGGTVFNLTTDDGWSIYGAHLSATIGSSRHVRAGDAIARVGNSGDAAGGDTHLHIGVRRVGGRPMNPYPFVLAACR